MTNGTHGFEANEKKKPVVTYSINKSEIKRELSRGMSKRSLWAWTIVLIKGRIKTEMGGKERKRTFPILPLCQVKIKVTSFFFTIKRKIELLYVAPNSPNVMCKYLY